MRVDSPHFLLGRGKKPRSTTNENHIPIKGLLSINSFSENVNHMGISFAKNYSDQRSDFHKFFFRKRESYGHFICEEFMEIRPLIGMWFSYVVNWAKVN
jgi:hypothetical protein